MAYFELLQRDYSDWMAQAAAPAPIVTPADGSVEPLDSSMCTVLLTALFDIEQAGLFCAVSASLAGTLASPKGTRLPLSHLATYAPVEDDAYPALKRRLIETGAPSGLVVALETQHARIAFAQRLTHALLRSSPDRQSARCHDDLEKLHDAWCRACRAALQASRTVRAALAQAGVHMDRLPFDGREAVVTDAAQGAWPCIDATGGITVPGWAEKRKAARYAVNRPARALIDGVTIPVFIKDASITGLGLTKVPRETLSGSAVTIILAGDERIAGRIAWSRNGAAGVALDQPLPVDHELFADVAG